jgi:hypothetical protein
MAFTTMAIIALSAYAASKTAADIIKARREREASDAATKAAADAAAANAAHPPAPPPSTSGQSGLDATAALGAMDRQRKRAAAGDTMAAGPARVGVPAPVAQPKTLLGY